MKAEEIFLSALEHKTPPERQAHLASACANDAKLRAEVEGLLRSHRDAGSFLDVPLFESPPMIDQPIAEKSGTMIGPYKLLQQIGEGGMGAVWMAQQSEPVKRLVAVKLIKTGMDSRQVIARFDAERQALALMDHGNIARVLDAGMTSSGRPYFVMDLVKGAPITSYCDEHRLTPRQRLELFLHVCHAVQHAHQKGIIHRDLKPSNVLVALYDGKPVPKVIDFGVAKATGQPLTDKTLVTGFGAIVGTLEYMSPEQAEINQLDIDTRSDIYSLGVLLYELLAGSPPFSRKELEKAGMLEMLRVIREQEPTKPSTKLSTAEGLPTLAANRGTEAAKLTRLVRGELDWIVMKCLEKDRNRRYETAGAFAADVQRYLDDEPVMACPPSTAYKLKKFAQRNQAAVLTAAAILFLLVAGIAGTTFGLIRAEHRRKEAEDARAAEAEQRQIADAQKKKAEQAQADTLADYRASTDEAIEELIGSKAELGPQEKNYLEKTLKRWQAFAAQMGDDEGSQAIRAEGHFRVASLWQKLGRPDQARTEFETARDLQHNLAAGFPSVPQHQQSLATTHHHLGLLLKDLGQRDAAHSEYEKARDLQQTLAAEFPTVPQHRHELAITHRNLGMLLAELGERDAARTEYETARDLEQKLVTEFPAAPQYRQELAHTHNHLAPLLIILGQDDVARTEYETAHDLKRKLAADFPAVPRYQEDLAASHFNQGSLLAKLGQRDAARTEYETARDLQQKLASAFPAVPKYQDDLASTHNNLGNLLDSLYGQRDAARAEYQLACALQQKLASAFPAVPQYQVDLGCSYNNVGLLLHDEGKWAESLTWYDLSIRTLTPIYEKDRRAVKERSYLRTSYTNRARAYDHLKKYVEAAQDWEKATECNPTPTYVALTAYRAALREEPNNAWLNDRLAWYLAHRRQTNIRDAKQAVRAAKKATELAPQERDYWHTLGIAHYRAENWKEAIAALMKSMELAQGGNSNDWLFLAMANWRLDNPVEARRWYDKAIEWMDEEPDNDELLHRFRKEAEELLQKESRSEIM
jgi:serine/threonine protein kinase/Flp pilus assembly protein TadD